MKFRKLPQKSIVLFAVGLILVGLGCSQENTSTTTSPILGTATTNDFNGYLAPGTDLPTLVAQTGITVNEYDPADNFIAFSSSLDEATLQGNAEFSFVDMDNPLTEPSDLFITFSKGYLSEAQMIGQTNLSCIDLSASHAKATGAGIRIAVLDTGFHLDHPHLVGHLETVTQSYDPRAGTSGAHLGHGTHVAGLIATVAPQATILPIRVMSDDGVGTEYDLIKGLKAAADAQADIVNLSLSMSQPSQAVESAIQNLINSGAVIVAAAGNYSSGGNDSKYPARYSNVIGVGSTQNSTCDDLISSSGLGVGIQFATAGEHVLSASSPLPSGLPGAAYGTGTSISAAVFSGSLALNMTVRRRALVVPPYDYTTEFQSTALSITPYGQVEWGAIDLLAALTLSGQ